ncbi:MAG: hypothetical protein HEEMFOPI_01491 [Holosporales bacterium]
MKYKKNAHFFSPRNESYILKNVEEISFVICVQTIVGIQTLVKKPVTGSYIMRMLTCIYDMPYGDLKKFLIHVENLISKYIIG